MWSGIYKITWQNLASLKSWIEMCNETVLQQLKGVEEYKTVNKAINSILAEVSLFLFKRPTQSIGDNFGATVAVCASACRDTQKPWTCSGPSFT